MKKVFKRAIPLILAIVMCLCLAAPAFAAAGTPTNAIGAFPSQSKSSYTAGYTKVIQRLMYVYNDTTKGYIEQGGGIDGGFGYYTDLAVKAFQAAKGFSCDGVFGSSSWPWLGNHLDSYVIGNYTQLWYNNYSYVIMSLGDMGSSGYLKSGTTWYSYIVNGTSNTGYNQTGTAYWNLFRTEE